MKIRPFPGKLRLTAILWATLITGCHSGPETKPVADIWSLYSGDRAFADVKRLVEMGPRPSGSGWHGHL